MPVLSEELELKLAAPPEFGLPELAGPATGVQRADPRPQLTLKTTYFDSPDLRLLSLGYTLRHRRTDGSAAEWTLKMPGNKNTRRIEVTFSASGLSPPAEARGLLAGILSGTALAPVVSLRTERQRWSLVGDDGSELAELVDDRVSVLNGRKTGPRFREVEVEASSADLRQLRRIARVISRAGAQPDQRSKLAKALALNGVSVPAPLLSPPAPSAPIELGIRFALQSAAQALLVADPQARAGDVEGLHQLRVATRRLRSVLRTFGPVVDPALREAVPGRFAWLGQASGMVRDLDVLIESLQAVADDEAASIAPLLAELSERQQIAASALRVCMDSAAYLEFARQLQVLRAVPEPDGPSAGSCHTQARLMLARPARDLRRGLRALPADPADEDLHRIRILAKRARYAGEICELLSKSAAARQYHAFSRRAEAMQNVLGRHHDAIVARSVLLAVAARESGDRRFFVAVGRLIEREAQAARDAHDEFLRLKDSLERKKHLWPAT